MGYPRASRKHSQLSDVCLQRLNTYALAAGAAGAGVLALAQPAGAEVVYTQAHHAILRHSSFPLDLNHDGKVDFYINQTSGCSSEGFCNNRLYAYVPFYRDRGNAVVGQNSFPWHAYALKAGAKIDRAQPFGGTALYFNSRAVRSDGRCSGSWVQATNRYLGLKFLIDREVHYGWVRLSARCELGTKVVGILDGYAYETVADKPILAGQTQDDPVDPSTESGSAEPQGPDTFWVDPVLQPAQPATLGMLALGAQGLSLWRRNP
jgi:hypothetical protein